jgi:hypothetical protein
MELPEEIVSIIREYSKPRFKYFREYKRVLEIKGVSDWPALREACGKAYHNSEVLQAMLAFERAAYLFEQVKTFDEKDPESWYQIELELDFYLKRDHRLECETHLDRLVA